MSPLCYLYAVTDAREPGGPGPGGPEPGGPGPGGPEPGVGGAEVTTVTVDGLVALVSEVSEAEFDQGPLTARLEDLGWLEATARAHHRVIEAAARAGPVLPFRLATVFRNPGRVRNLLNGRQAELSAALDRIRGRREWGIKAYATAEPAVDPVPPAATGRPGTDYLMRKRGRRDAAARAARLAEEQAEELHARASELAASVRRYPPQDPRLSGCDEPMVLNASYLVAGEQESGLAELTATVRPGVRVELTGPWAAYSFTELETAAREDGS